MTVLGEPAPPGDRSVQVCTDGSGALSTVPCTAGRWAQAGDGVAAVVKGVLRPSMAAHPAPHRLGRGGG